MIKLTNTYLVGIITATLLVGCVGSDGSSADGGGSTTSTTTTTTTTASAPSTTTTTTASAPTTTTSASKKFGADVMPILIAKCKGCHGTNGRFTITTTTSTYNNIQALTGSPAGGQRILQKGSGTIGHGGGTVITTSSAEYATIKSWVDAGAQNN